MKSLIFGTLILMNFSLQAKEPVVMVCTEKQEVTGFEVLLSKKVVTITNLGKASKSEIKEAMSTGELDIDQDDLDNYEVDEVLKVQVKIEDVLGAQKTTLLDVTTYALTADVSYWISSSTFHQFDFNVYLDEMEESSLSLYGQSLDGEQKFDLACDYK